MRRSTDLLSSPYYHTRVRRAAESKEAANAYRQSEMLAIGSSSELLPLSHIGCGDRLRMRGVQLAMRKERKGYSCTNTVVRAECLIPHQGSNLGHSSNAHNSFDSQVRLISKASCEVIGADLVRRNE